MEKEINIKKRQWSEPSITEIDIKMTECFDHIFGGGHHHRSQPWYDGGCS